MLAPLLSIVIFSGVPFHPLALRKKRRAALRSQGSLTLYIASCIESMQGCGGSLRHCCGCPVIVRRAEAALAPAEGVFERVVQHGGAHVMEGLHRIAIRISDRGRK